MKTSDGRESADPRDFSKAPDLGLDPWWILLMRERLRNAAGAGWPAFRASREQDKPDWSSK